MAISTKRDFKCIFFLIFKYFCLIIMNFSEYLQVVFFFFVLIFVYLLHFSGYSNKLSFTASLHYRNKVIANDSLNNDAQQCKVRHNYRFWSNRHWTANDLVEFWIKPSMNSNDILAVDHKGDDRAGSVCSLQHSTKLSVLLSLVPTKSWIFWTRG